MTATSEVGTVSSLVDLLAAALSSLGLQAAGSLEELLKAHDGAVYLKQPAIRLARHFDIQPDLLVYDPGLGTLGLIQTLRPSPESLGAAVRQEIDRATYVRHLLLTEATRSDLTALSVELVLVIPEDVRLRASLAAALQATARDTQYLRSIGVSILPARDGATRFDDRDLRRAFAWLLLATRSWYEGVESTSKTEPKQTQAARRDGRSSPKLASITLEDYRLSGRRELRLADTARIHLVHGHNGSGKSSLVEALEYVLTGAVERLGTESNYDGVIRHQGAQSPAQVTLAYRGGGHSGPHAVMGPLAEAPVPPGVKAAAFRLDQNAMDLLTRMGPALRHKTFGEAFFPEQSLIYGAYDRARQEAQLAYDELPVSVRTAIDNSKDPTESVETAVVNRLNSLGSSLEPEPLSAQLLADCLPLSPATLERLGAFDPELRQLVNGWQTSPPAVKDLAEVLPKVDGALERVRPVLGGYQAQVQMAITVVGALKDWQATPQPTAEDFGETLNVWLELTALADLAERYHQLRQTFELAGQHGWAMSPEADGLFNAVSLDRRGLGELQEQAAKWTAERDECAARLQPTLQVMHPSAGTAPRRPTRLTNVEVTALDAVGQWLFTRRDANLLGQQLQAALNSGTPITMEDVVIGLPGWAEHLLTRLNELDEAMRELLALGDASSSWSGVRRHQLLSRALGTHRALAIAGQLVSQSFLGQLSPDVSADGSAQGLIAAINELLVLFTPARWAYQDIGLEAVQDALGQRSLRLVTPDRADADLRFNTAELNVFTVALFLLCARRAPNSLKLLVLDDPLQNMDELTVTYVARGLAEVIRLWDADWQLMLLFHGEADLERFGAEVAGSVYLLPWLSPFQEHGLVTIEPDKARSSSSDALQQLDGLVSARP